MNEYSKRGKYWVNCGTLSKYTFSCDSKKCVQKGDCCCSIYEVDVSSAEMSRIVGLIEPILKYCPDLYSEGELQNIFSEESGRYAIDKNENGFCAFSYKNKQGELRCSIQSAAENIGLDPFHYKPKCCSNWPLSIISSNKKMFVTLDLENLPHCVTKIQKGKGCADSSLLSMLDEFI